MEYYSAIRNNDLQKALNNPETTYRLYEVQEKQRPKKEKNHYDYSLHTKNSLTISRLHLVLHVLYAHCN